jgi:hypothetical protein
MTTRSINDLLAIRANVIKRVSPISIIEVAATFATLSYADNGGEVQITSAGVHSLTTNPAVGKMVYVSWAAGTGVDGLYTILSVDSTTAITIDLTYVVGLGTPTVAVANTKIALDTIVIPGGTLGETGFVRFEFIASQTNSAQNKTYFVEFGGTAYLQVVQTTVDSVRVTKEIINRTASSQFDSAVAGLGYGTGGVITTSSVDTSSDVNLVFSATPASANQFVQIEGYYITYNQ